MTNAFRRGVKELLEKSASAVTLGRVSRRTLSVALQSFDPLVRHFGRRAGKDVALLVTACEKTLETGSRSALAVGHAAGERLRKLTAGLPVDAQTNVAVEIERHVQTLLFRDEKLGQQLAMAAETLRGTRVARGVRSTEHEALEKLANKAHAFFFKRIDQARKAGAPIHRIFRRFRRCVAPSSLDLHAAAYKAVQHAEEFRTLVRQYGRKHDPGVLERIWGILSTVRGSLGEGYALASRIWRVEEDILLADAMNHAFRLSEQARAVGRVDDAYEAVVLTQTAHKIRINGKEGPDLMVVILDHARRKMIVRARAQVKVAKASQGAAQTLNDELRFVGEEVGKQDLPLVEIVRGGNPETYVVEVLPSIREDRYLLDMAGSRVPGPDLAALAAAGRSAESIVLDMSVHDFTQITIILMEAAIDALP